MAKRPTSIPDKVLAAAMALAEEKPWRNVSLNEIAASAKVSLAQMHSAYGSKGAILAGLMARADDEVLSGIDKDAAEEPPRDRLIDSVMRRLDALSPYKPALRSILRDLGADPVSALCLLPGYMNAMAWTLESAGIGSAGLGGRLRVKGLAAIYAATVLVWLRDDSEDQGRTLAFLDARLKQAERMLPFLPGSRRRGRAGDPSD